MFNNFDVYDIFDRYQLYVYHFAGEIRVFFFKIGGCAIGTVSTSWGGSQLMADMQPDI